MKILGYIVLSLLLLVSSHFAHAKGDSLQLKLSASVLKSLEGYDLTIQENRLTKEVKISSNGQAEIVSAEPKMIHKFTLNAKKEKQSTAFDIFLFPKSNNLIDIKRLIISKFLDAKNFRHLDTVTIEQFYNQYPTLIKEQYKKLSNIGNESVFKLMDYTSALNNMDAYLKDVHPAITILKNAALETVAKNQQPFEKIIDDFIAGINSNDTRALAAMQYPKASDKKKDIYLRGLKTLNSYFNKIGNPTQYVEEKRSDIGRATQYIKANYVRIILKNLNTSKKVEMEFFFRDEAGYRYITEYDISGINFR